MSDPPAFDPSPLDPARLPSLELLNETHTFPGPYLFKVIGEDDRSFAARVVSLVRDELGLEEDPVFTIRRTKSGRHLSVTLEPQVPTAQSVVDLYQLIYRLEGLVMVL
ncbi:YbeD family protein [Alienimonas californiensis]|uniref:DUF493 domain-containing protein n=1 Tax=Alienimonas californiensis TaxID=2527989 RepID=A0A517PD17_9PLAN|nr:DUF493 domain-containing protein [Alienimonas californiensis]QDT17278.1 hypothetical protein CA12_33980 [Alienimonas californiensis]